MHKTSSKDSQFLNRPSKILLGLKNSEKLNHQQKIQLILDYEELVSDLYFYRSRLTKNDPGLRKLEVLVSDITSMLSYKQKMISHNKDELSWKQKYQKIWYDNFGLFVMTVIIFAASFLIGINIGMYKEDYALIFIPQSALENVLDKHKWFEELQSAPILGALQIALNNIRVAFYTIVGGVLLGIGGLYYILFNGIVIGGLFGYCIANDFHFELSNFIAAHGFVELTMIAVAGFTSFLIGRVFYLRPLKLIRENIQKVVTEAMLMFFVVATWLFLIALFEGLVSPFHYLDSKEKSVLGFGLFTLFWLWTFAKKEHLSLKR